MSRLKFNPIVTTAHYEFHFQVSRTTAWRMHKADKKELRARKISFSRFADLYGSYPDPSFKPVFVS